MAVKKPEPTVVPPTVKAAVPEVPGKATLAEVANGCVAPVGKGLCGKPKAEGQTYVCIAHVRAG